MENEPNSEATVQEQLDQLIEELGADDALRLIELGLETRKAWRDEAAERAMWAMHHEQLYGRHTH